MITFRIPILGERLWFPDPERSDPDGLLAAGGDLSAERLLLAYRSGIFPWTVDPITWWSPNPRAIFSLETFHVPQRLERLIRQKRFSLTFDRAFYEVMLGCSQPRSNGEETWITPEFIAAYFRLHQMGFAHSVEAWENDQLVGGVYGVTIGGLFAGESMFFRAPNASRIALTHLIRHLRTQGFVLFDSQVINPATRSCGAQEIPRPEYLQRLKAAIALPVSFSSLG